MYDDQEQNSSKLSVLHLMRIKLTQQNFVVCGNCALKNTFMKEQYKVDWIALSRNENNKSWVQLEAINY
jgi:hypothetical protein